MNRNSISIVLPRPTNPARHQKCEALATAGKRDVVVVSVDVVPPKITTTEHHQQQQQQRPIRSTTNGGATSDNGGGGGVRTPVNDDDDADGGGNFVLMTDRIIDNTKKKTPQKIPTPSDDRNSPALGTMKSSMDSFLPTNITTTTTTTTNSNKHMTNKTPPKSAGCKNMESPSPTKMSSTKRFPTKRSPTKMMIHPKLSSPLLVQLDQTLQNQPAKTKFYDSPDSPGSPGGTRKSVHWNEAIDVVDYPENKEKDGKKNRSFDSDTTATYSCDSDDNDSDFYYSEDPHQQISCNPITNAAVLAGTIDPPVVEEDEPDQDQQKQDQKCCCCCVVNVSPNILFLLVVALATLILAVSVKLSDAHEEVYYDPQNDKDFVVIRKDVQFTLEILLGGLILVLLGGSACYCFNTYLKSADHDEDDMMFDNDRHHYRNKRRIDLEEEP